MLELELEFEIDGDVDEELPIELDNDVWEPVADDLPFFFLNINWTLLALFELILSCLNFFMVSSSSVGTFELASCFEVDGVVGNEDTVFVYDAATEIEFTCVACIEQSCP